MGAVIGKLEECRRELRRKKPRPLLVFDDRDEETRRHEAMYQVARPEE